MDDTERQKLQRYLGNLFGNRTIRVKRGRRPEVAEVEVNDEFIGTIYRDVDEGEVSYTFNMAILDIDLEDT